MTDSWDRMPVTVASSYNHSMISNRPGQQRFATTRWSMVLAAGAQNDDGSHEALTELCESYWYPLYAYVRRRVSDVHEAQDLTQSFFTHLMEKDALAHVQPHRGRFRSFLLTALKHFLANEWRNGRTQKRGGGNTVLSLDFDSAESRFQAEPSHEVTPEKLFERRWVLTLLDQVLERLRLELTDAGREVEFEQLKIGLTGEASAADYEQAGDALGISADAAKQAAYRLRKRYRELFRQEVARTVADGQDVNDELRRLLDNLS